MYSTQTTAWSHSNRYSSDRACKHCEGIIRHEPWCITNNQIIRYAYQAVLNADKLSAGDHIILHALGVRWVANSPCACSPSQQPTNVVEQKATISSSRHFV